MEQSGCSSLEAENARLKAEVRRLKQVLHQVGTFSARQYNLWALAQQRGNLPRGKWAYIKGKGKTAQGVLELLKG
jgi:hypothetical protein